MRRPRETDAAARVAALDWQEVAASLDARGYATAARLLSPEECRGLAALYDRGEAFRSREGRAPLRGSVRFQDFVLRKVRVGFQFFNLLGMARAVA